MIEEIKQSANESTSKPDKNEYQINEKLIKCNNSSTETVV